MDGRSPCQGTVVKVPAALPIILVCYDASRAVGSPFSNILALKL